MTTDLFEVKPIAGKIGAEVNGLDLRQLNDNQTWDALQSAFLKHKVLAIRDQDLEPDDMMAISEKFGGLRLSVRQRHRRLPVHFRNRQRTSRDPQFRRRLA